jgi:hypothetical protein
LTHNESHSIWQEFVTVIFDDFSEVVSNSNNKQNRVAVFFPNSVQIFSLLVWLVADDRFVVRDGWWLVCSERKVLFAGG